MDGAGILYWNQAAEQLYWVHPRRGSGKGDSRPAARPVTRKPVKELESMLARYGVWIGEMRHTTRDGRIVEVEGRLSLMSQRSGKWLVLEVNRDVDGSPLAPRLPEPREKRVFRI